MKAIKLMLVFALVALTTQSCDKIADKISDHCPILMQFDIQQQDND